MSGTAKKEEISKILDDLSNDEENIKKKAIFFAGEKKISEAIPILMDILKTSEVNILRNNSARALGKLKAKDAVDQLIEALNDRDYYVRQSAAWSLGKIKDPKALEPLFMLIKGGGAKMYTSSGAASKVKTEEVNETLVSDGMKYHDVQIKAIKALGDIGDEKAVGALISEFDDEEVQIRCAVALALGKIGSKKAVPRLIEGLNDAHWTPQRDSAIALGKIKDLRAIDPLIGKLNNKYLDVIEKSARALQALGPVAIAKAFLLKPKNEHVKKLIKNTFKSKKDLLDGLMKAAELEKDQAKQIMLRKKIQALFG